MDGWILHTFINSLRRRARIAWHLYWCVAWNAWSRQLKQQQHNLHLTIINLDVVPAVRRRRKTKWRSVRREQRDDHTLLGMAWNLEWEWKLCGKVCAAVAATVGVSVAAH